MRSSAWCSGAASRFSIPAHLMAQARVHGGRGRERLNFEKLPSSRFWTMRKSLDELVRIEESQASQLSCRCTGRTLVGSPTGIVASALIDVSWFILS